MFTRAAFRLARQYGVRSFSFAARAPVTRWGLVGATACATGFSLAHAGSVNYDEVRKSIAGILDAPTHDDGSLGPVFIRLAWHASGTYDKKDGTGGSNGATMRFKPESDHGANAGLGIARGHLDKIKAQYPDISYADLWTLAGVVAVEEMGGPKIEWRPGRSDAASGAACPPDGRLPDAAQGAQHVRDIFYKMGFNDQEIVALAGAHCFGRCHTDRSGYTGPWTRAPTTFSNQFYTELINNKWTPKKWNGPNQFEDPTGQLMMTPADMAFLNDPAFRKYTELYAKDSDKFEKDFAKAYSKLLHLGVPAGQCDKSKFPLILAAVIGVAASSRFV